MLFYYSVSYLVFKTNPLVSILFTLATNLSYFLLHHLVYLNQQEQVLIFQYLIYQLQFLNWLNLMLAQKSKYQHVKYF